MHGEEDGGGGREGGSGQERGVYLPDKPAGCHNGRPEASGRKASVLVLDEREEVCVGEESREHDAGGSERKAGGVEVLLGRLRRGEGNHRKPEAVWEVVVGPGEEQRPEQRDETAHQRLPSLRLQVRQPTPTSQTLPKVGGTHKSWRILSVALDETGRSEARHQLVKIHHGADGSKNRQENERSGGACREGTKGGHGGDKEENEGEGGRIDCMYWLHKSELTLKTPFPASGKDEAFCSSLWFGKQSCCVPDLLHPSNVVTSTYLARNAG